mmetsp:Transcript_18280/g.41777  ORF Transcript_18280/g.41777 Transcript_18280/m.41777 type:complete len:463 (-) Transcript_18280:280-1668(-)
MRLEHLGARGRVQQAHLDRDVEGLGRGLARAGGVAAALTECHGPLALGGVQGGLEDLHGRGARLRVPPLELRQVKGVGVGHGRPEVVARDRLPVVPRKVQVQALFEPLAAQERLVHADHLGALGVHGRGVEVVHGDVGLGADWVRHRPAVLGELPRPQPAHVADALHRGGAHVGAELLVPINRQALLKRELKPVPARHTVPRPVVEVLVADDRLDARVVRVSGRRGLGEGEGGVEHVETLVLHGAHVEVVHGHDVVHVQIVLEPVAILVPLHGLVNGLEGVVELVHVGVLAEDLDPDPPVGELGHVLALDGAEVPRHHREEVARLLEGVLPFGEVARPLRPGHLPRLHLVPVAQQDRVAGLVGLDVALVGGHDVGAVEVGGDSPEAFSLALRAEHARRLVEPRELQVRRGGDRGDRLEGEGPFLGERRAWDRELVVFEGEPCDLAVPVDGDRLDLQIFGVKH